MTKPAARSIDQISEVLLTRHAVAGARHFLGAAVDALESLDGDSLAAVAPALEALGTTTNCCSLRITRLLVRARKALAYVPEP